MNTTNGSIRTAARSAYRTVSLRNVQRTTGLFHLLVPDQTLRCGISGSELPGYAQRALRAHHAPADSSRSCGGPAAFLLRGSAAAPAAAVGGTALCRSYKHRLPLAVSGGSMARTSGQGAAARGSVQRRKRKFHAGNTPDRERILSKDTPLAHDLPAALLGDDGQRLYAGHQQPRRPEDPVRGQQSRPAEHLLSSAGSL